MMLQIASSTDPPYLSDCPWDLFIVIANANYSQLSSWKIETKFPFKTK